MSIPSARRSMMAPRSIASAADLSRPAIFSPSGADRDQPLDMVADRGFRRLKHADQAADDGKGRPPGFPRRAPSGGEFAPIVGLRAHGRSEWWRHPPRRVGSAHRCVPCVPPRVWARCPCRGSAAATGAWRAVNIAAGYVRQPNRQVTTRSDVNTCPLVSGLHSSATITLTNPNVVPISIGMAKPSS